MKTEPTDRINNQLGTQLDALSDKLGLDPNQPFSMAQWGSSLAEKTREAADCTHRMVQGNPWTCVGIAAGLGLLLGLCSSRK